MTHTVRLAVLVVVALAGVTAASAQVVVVPGSVVAPQRLPARDAAARQPDSGTSVIRGRVVAADTGTPIRRAQIEASPGGRDRARAVLTDENGVFELRDLPAGRWSIRASKTGFLTQQYGQRSPFASGQPVTIAEGEELTANFFISRAGAIAGRVYDELGDPIAGARVSVLQSQMTPTGPRLTSFGTSVPSDDTGAYRVYGLAPGQYYVSATSTAMRNGPANSEGAPVTYAPTYYPGTADLATAQPITLRAGEEQHGVQFTLAPVRAARVSGTVIGLNGSPLSATVALQQLLVSGGPAASVRSARTSANGTFALDNVPPGNYALGVTSRVRGNTPPEVASVPIVVSGSDLTGLTVVTTSGAVVTGTVRAESGALPPSGVRVTAQPLRTGAGGRTARAQVAADGSFVLEGLIGPMTFNIDRLPAGWVAKSIVANGIDVADLPMELRGTERVTVDVVLTDRVTEILGSIHVQGEPAAGASVVIFPDDPSKWSFVSRYLRSARAGDDGTFTLRGLPPHTRYLAVAVEFLEQGDALNPEFLQSIKERATGFSLDEGEQKALALDLVSR